MNSELAELYLDRDSDSFDEEKALECLIRGSEQDDIDCIKMLIDGYSNGDLTGISPSEIERWKNRFDELDSLIYKYEW